jgi:N-acetylglucosamine kinase-like BadF-type ATPase
MSVRWVFGIDGGGTSARLRLEDLDGGFLHHGEGGSSNLRSNSREAVLENLSALFAEALARTGVSASDCVAGFAGSAGVDRADDRRPFAELVRAALLRAAGPGGGAPAAAIASIPIEAGNDSEPALAGAIGDIEGLLLIAGTGSIAYARGRDGAEARAGGWGHLLGDEGSAFDVAFQALKRGMRSWEGRDLPTGLLDASLGFFGLSAPEDLVPLVYEGLDKTRIAKFARVVAAYRDRGDRLAVSIFDRAAASLADLVLSVDARVGSHISRKRLAFRGGLIEGNDALRSEVTARVLAADPAILIVPAAADSATGACILARSLLPAK